MSRYDHHICASITDAYPEGILVAIHLNHHYHDGIEVKPLSELLKGILNLLSNLDTATEGFFMICDRTRYERPEANIYYLRSSISDRFSEQTARSDAKTAINLLEMPVTI